MSVTMSLHHWKDVARADVQKRKKKEGVNNFHELKYRSATGLTEALLEITLREGITNSKITILACHASYAKKAAPDRKYNFFFS
jgi:predicted nucleotidyltransferase